MNEIKESKARRVTGPSSKSSMKHIGNPKVNQKRRNMATLWQHLSPTGRKNTEYGNTLATNTQKVPILGI
jgi:hypothetical protein